ncbi:MAG: chemotaxis response regulator protein-glutamate methylesterase [Verrucomicrobiota bacterium]
MITNQRIRVLVVDDSSVVRKMICDALAKDPQIEVVGTAPDPYIARDKIKELNPDVLTLDIEMPRMDGLTFLKILQQHRPIPVIIISSLTQSGSAAAIEAMESGAVEVLAKPSSAYSIGNLGEELSRHVRAAAGARVQRRPAATPATRDVAATPLKSASLIAPKPVGNFHPRQIIAIGSSTGGVEALGQVLTKLPVGLPGIAITQHIPPYFSRVFAERINSQAAIEVREAAEGDLLQPGMALIAPGDYHMTLSWVGSGFRVALNQKPPVHHCRPAVDVMFRSIAEISGARVVAAILTGMGSDGAMGMKALKAIGARTIAQDEASCVVYGMPRAAVEAGVVDKVLSLNSIPNALIETAQAMATSAPAERPLTTAKL